MKPARLEGFQRLKYIYILSAHMHAYTLGCEPIDIVDGAQQMLDYRLVQPLSLSLGIIIGTNFLCDSIPLASISS